MWACATVIADDEPEAAEELDIDEGAVTEETPKKLNKLENMMGACAIS